MINIKDIQIIDHDDTPDVIIFNEDLPKYDGYEFDIFDENEFNRYILYIEKIVRNSFEYRRFIRFLRNNVGMDKCSFFENVTNAETFKVQIHLHHHPFDLNTITRIVFKRRFEAHECVETEAVAKEVMWIHSNLLVGLIPLCETAHELVHNFYLFIPIDNVLGMVDTFMEFYDPWIEPEHKNLYKSIVEYSKVFNEAENMNPLLRKYIYIDQQQGSAIKLPTFEDVLRQMNNQVAALKASNGKTFPAAITMTRNDQITEIYNNGKLR